MSSCLMSVILENSPPSVVWRGMFFHGIRSLVVGFCHHHPRQSLPFEFSFLIGWLASLLESYVIHVDSTSCCHQDVASFLESSPRPGSYSHICPFGVACRIIVLLRHYRLPLTNLRVAYICVHRSVPLHPILHCLCYSYCSSAVSYTHLDVYKRQNLFFIVPF